ncbi:MAG: hypothetical protein ACR2IE_13130 [Candidatus Sumerlaeaceae bacterium]
MLASIAGPFGRLPPGADALAPAVVLASVGAPLADGVRVADGAAVGAGEDVGAGVAVAAAGEAVGADVGFPARRSRRRSGMSAGTNGVALPGFAVSPAALAGGAVVAEADGASVGIAVAAGAGDDCWSAGFAEFWFGRGFLSLRSRGRSLGTKGVSRLPSGVGVVDTGRTLSAGVGDALAGAVGSGVVGGV